jgi:hypothetical protein
MRTCDLTCPLICSFRHHSPPHTSPCTCRPQCTMQCSTAKLQQHLYCWLLRSACCSSHLHVGFSFRQRADSNYYISSPASYCLTLGLHCPAHNVSVRPVMHVSADVGHAIHACTVASAMPCIPDSVSNTASACATWAAPWFVFVPLVHAVCFPNLCAHWVSVDAGRKDRRASYLPSHSGGTWLSGPWIIIGIAGLLLAGGPVITSRQLISFSSCWSQPSAVSLPRPCPRCLDTKQPQTVPTLPTCGRNCVLALQVQGV